MRLGRHPVRAHLELVPALRQLGRAGDPLRVHIAEPDGAIEGEAEAAGSEPADAFAIAIYGLAAIEERVRILDYEGHQPAGDAGLALTQKRFPPDEIGLFQIDREAEPRFDGRVVGIDLRSPDPAGLLHAQRIERAIAAMT